jgi:hypothetical protein
MAAMTFLQLCQRTREKCGISGNGPVTTASQTGELLRVVNWVNEAWEDLQNDQDTWNWMRAPFSFTTTAGKQSYSPASDLALQLPNFQGWHLDTLRCFNTATGPQDEQFLAPWDYQQFRNFYEYQVRPNGRPMVAAVQPWDRSILLGNTPDDVYTVRGEYQLAARPFANDADVPGLPGEYHMLIVYGAMQKYAAYENANEVAAEAVRAYARLKGRLSQNQLMGLSFGAPLA